MITEAGQHPARQAATTAPAATALGLLAFAADAIDGTAGQVMVALVSSGLAWGLAGVLAGRAAGERRGAAASATALLVSATLVYYLMILLVSRRWIGDSPVDSSHGLRSLAMMTTAWLLISLLAGPLLGLLGHMTRCAPPRTAALAIGATCGALSGQGWQEIFLAPSGHMGQIAVTFRGIGAAELIETILPLAVFAWLTTRRRLGQTWPVLLTALVTASALSALTWHLLRTAANQLG